MPIISEEEGNERLKEHGDLLEIREKQIRTKKEPLTDEEREAIAIAKRTGIATNKELGALFGITPAYAGNLATGKPDGTHQDSALIARVDRKLNTVRAKAVDKLLSTLDFITEEKLEKAPIRDIASTAAALSKVATAQLGPDAHNEGVKLIVYAPQFKQENNYKVSDVSS